MPQNQVPLSEIAQDLEYTLNGLKKTIIETQESLSKIPTRIYKGIDELTPFLNRIKIQQEDTNSRLDKILKGIEGQKQVEERRARAEENLAVAVRELTSQMKINAEMMKKGMLKPAQNSATTQTSPKQVPNTTSQTPIEEQPTQTEARGISQKLAQQSPSPKVSKEEEIANDILNMLAYGVRTIHSNGTVEIHAQDNPEHVANFLKAYNSYLNHTGKKVSNEEKNTHRIPTIVCFEPEKNDFEIKLVQIYDRDRAKHTESRIVAEVMRRRASIHG